MSGDLGTGTGSAGGNILLYEGADTWPGILSMDKVQGAGLSKMSREWMIMFVPQDL